ncbi:SCO6880 family protein [Kribbella sp. CA-293567]|uniref:SCO6880 family protein n=1 Tax=Kribbella sp. CA-293567 TaxID=3002436 RepID=UPI0022DCF480|nr:SCO6880 family protein [Kribbella sp. CA-293567]WBQ04403.1 type VII secretion protein EccE [Kribbella sp. CA-293567]
MSTLSTRFPRPERNAVLLGLRPIQVALVAAAVLTSTLAVVTTATPVVKSVGMVAAGLILVVAFAKAEGLPMHRWLVLRAVSFWRPRSYRARVMQPRNHGRLQLPGEKLELLSWNSRIGIVHDKRRNRLIAVARIEGPAHLLQNSDEQDRRVTAYGQMIAGLCHGNRIARAQILERTLPDPGDEVGAWAKRRNVDARTSAGAIYTDLLDRAAPAAAKHETLFAFAVNLDAVSREVRKHGGGITGAVAVLESEARAFQTSLASAGVVGTWLAADDLTMSLRLAFDPKAVRGPKVSEAADVSPLAIDADWDLLRTDSSFHRVYVISEWPRVRTTPSFLSPLLLKPGIRRTFTLVLQPIPMARALRDARRHQVERITDRTTRKRIGQLETEEDRQQDADVAQRERDLAAGHGDVRWLGLVVVSADDEEKLDDACMEVEIAATQALLDLRRLVGQQADGFLAGALPFGIGL